MRTLTFPFPYVSFIPCRSGLISPVAVGKSEGVSIEVRLRIKQTDALVADILRWH